MKLHYSPASPYARKVLLAALELGYGDRIVLERAAATPTATETGLDKINPLAKIPTLEADDGAVLYDSRVIIEYLDVLSGGKLLPAAGPARFSELRLQATADGICDAALLARYENALRPEPLRWEDWTRGQLRKINLALDALEAEFAASPTGFGLGAIAVFSALQYLDFRFADLGWRASHPTLARFFAATAERPAVKALPDQNA